MSTHTEAPADRSPHAARAAAARPPHVRLVGVVGAKGGTLKTTTTRCLAHLLAADGVAVVLVDADPQGTLTRRHELTRAPDPLGADPVAVYMGAARRCAEGVALHLFRGGRRLEHADAAAVARHLARARALASAAAVGAGTDRALVLVDTLPTLGPIAQATIAAADLVLVPTPEGIEGLEGYADVREAVGRVQPAPTLRGVLTQVQRRTRLYAESVAAVRQLFPGEFYDADVPHEVAGKRGGTWITPVTGTAPHSRSAAAYWTLAAAVARDLGFRVGGRGSVFGPYFTPAGVRGAPPAPVDAREAPATRGVGRSQPGGAHAA